MKFDNITFGLLLVCTAVTTGEKTHNIVIDWEMKFGNVSDNDTSTNLPRVVDRLYKYLFETYHKELRPVFNESTITEVQIMPVPGSVVDLDEQKSTMQLLTWQFMQWTDELLRWNPEDFDGISKIKVPATDIWMPDITVYNAIEIDSHTLAIDNTRQDLIVLLNSNGTLRTVFMQRFTARCDSMDLREFPFDIQTCRIRYGSFLYHNREVSLIFEGGEFDRDFSSIFLSEVADPKDHHPEWEIVSLSWNESVPETYDIELEGGNVTYDGMVFEIGVERNRNFYHYTIAMPTLIITTLGIIGLFAPVSNRPKRTEKVSFGSAVVLGLVLMLLILAEGMPRNNNSQSRLGDYIVFEMTYIVCASVASTVVLHSHAKALTHGWVPLKPLYIAGHRFTWLSGRQRYDELEARLVALRQKMRREKDERTASRRRGLLVGRLRSAANVVPPTNMSPDVIRSIQSIQRNLKRIQETMLTREEEAILELHWQSYFQTIDYILLVVFFCFNFIASFFLYFPALRKSTPYLQIIFSTNKLGAAQ